MADDEFEKLVDAGFRALPEQFRRRIKNVVIRIEDEPSEEVRREHGLSDGETLFGLYVGVPETERGSGYGLEPTLPDTITIYQKPIEEEAAGNPERIKEIVADTIWHEFGHYFGLEEGEVHKREDERGIH